MQTFINTRTHAGYQHQCASDENNHQNEFNRLAHLINDRFDFLDRHIDLNQGDRRHKLQQL